MLACSCCYARTIRSSPPPPPRFGRFLFSSSAVTEDTAAADHGCSRPLGYPIPEDEHACSVSLPTWSSVVGYEEGNPAVTAAMKCGYPRFVYHPYVLRLMETVLEQHGAPQEDCLVLPSAAAAVRCQAFLQNSMEGKKGQDNALLEGATVEDAVAMSSSSSSRVRTVSVGAAQVHAVLFPAETEHGMQAKAYWQHAGEVVSSRRAECAMQQLGVSLQSQVTPGQICYSSFREQDPNQSASAPTPEVQLRERIANWAKVPDANHVFLSPSGMASIYTALRSARRLHLSKHPGGKGGASIVFGFPYLDTLKLCSRSEICPAGVEFFGRGDERDLADLEKMLESGRCKPSVLFTEVPSNPLLQCPDMIKLRELADKYDFCLVVDDTISNFLNADLLESGLADAVASSLTKLVSGRGDAMAGSMVANPATEKGRWMQQDLTELTDTMGGLYEPDAVAILRNSADFPERNDKINANSESLADWLEEHPDIQTVYYPKSVPLYKQVQSGGFGGLMSIVLHPHMCQRTFYDALDVAKGPSLGTNFTLVCPYTLLAHYHELDFAMTYNVPPNLLRVAVGMEPLSVLQSKFETAFSMSRLYPKPKLTLDPQQKRGFSTWSGARWTGGGQSSPWRRSAQFALRQLVHL